MKRKPSKKAKTILALYEKLTLDLDKTNLEYLEKMSKVVNLGFKEKIDWGEVYTSLLDLFYNGAFEKHLKRIKQYFKEAHNIDIDLKKLPLDELLYSKDGLTFEERLQQHVDKCKDGTYNLLNMTNALDKILNTETSCIFHNIQHTAFDDEEFVVCEFVGGCDKCTGEFSDGEIYRWDECNEGSGPPYHPNCGCHFVDWIAEEDERRDLFPESYPALEEEGY